MTLGDALDGRDNALNFVRLVLAATVVVVHTGPVGGFPVLIRFGDLNVGDWAVAGFFGISGYLISGSRARLPWWRFALARVLRIFPGYWLALLMVAFVFAPLAAILTSTPIDLGAGARYAMVNVTTLPQEWAFGQALTRAYRPTEWNGSVWTLSHELGCYVVVGAALTIPLIRRRAASFAVLLLTWTTTVDFVLTTAGIGRGQWMPADFNRFLTFFAGGMLLWALRARVKVDGRLAMVCALGFVGIAAAHHTDELGALPAAYVALWSGARLGVRWCRTTDLSYGLYVLAWPVQTVMGLAGLTWLGYAGFATCALAITLGLAALSWRYVELPALNLRRRVDHWARGRGDGATRELRTTPALLP